MHQSATDIYGFCIREHRREMKMSILTLFFALCLSFMPAPVQACSPLCYFGGGSFSECCTTQQEAEDYVGGLIILNICHVKPVVLGEDPASSFNGYVRYQQCTPGNGSVYYTGAVYFGVPTDPCPDNNPCCGDPLCGAGPIGCNVSNSSNSGK